MGANIQTSFGNSLVRALRVLVLSAPFGCAHLDHPAPQHHSPGDPASTGTKSTYFSQYTSFADKEAAEQREFEKRLTAHVMAPPPEPPKPTTRKVLKCPNKDAPEVRAAHEAELEAWVQRVEAHEREHGAFEGGGNTYRARISQNATTRVEVSKVRRTAREMAGLMDAWKNNCFWVEEDIPADQLDTADPAPQQPLPELRNVLEDEQPLPPAATPDPFSR